MEIKQKQIEPKKMISWKSDRINDWYLFAPEAIALGFPESVAREGYPREDITKLRIPQGLFLSVLFFLILSSAYR